MKYQGRKRLLVSVAVVTATLLGFSSAVLAFADESAADSDKTCTVSSDGVAVPCDAGGVNISLLRTPNRVTNGRPFSLQGKVVFGENTLSSAKVRVAISDPYGGWVNSKVVSANSAGVFDVTLTLWRSAKLQISVVGTSTYPSGTLVTPLIRTVGGPEERCTDVEYTDGSKVSLIEDLIKPLPTIVMNAAATVKKSGQAVKVSGTLKYAGKAVKRAKLFIYQSGDGVKWKRVKTISTNASGRYSASVKIAARSWLRAEFPETKKYAAAWSRSKEVKVLGQRTL